MADGKPGAAVAWLKKNRQALLWISPVTFAEVLEGAGSRDAVRQHLQRYRWQGLHHAQAEAAAAIQAKSPRRMGENDAWQAALVVTMKCALVGHDPKAFSPLGRAYIDHRAVR